MTIDKSGFDLLIGISDLALGVCRCEHDYKTVQAAAIRCRRLSLSSTIDKSHFDLLIVLDGLALDICRYEHDYKPIYKDKKEAP